MKARTVICFHVSALSLIFALPCFAQSNSLVSATTANTAISAANTANWESQSASDTAPYAKVVTEQVYYQGAHSMKDISLEARIKAVLQGNKSTRDSDVHIMADNGMVTLTGGAPSEQNAQYVQEVVASVDGVKAVNNDLNYPHSKGTIIPRDADSMGIVHPAYSDTAPAEYVPIP